MEIQRQKKDQIHIFGGYQVTSGGKCSPKIFNKLTQAVHRVMAREGFNATVVYLDDFLVISKTRGGLQAAHGSPLSLL